MVGDIAEVGTVTGIILWMYESLGRGRDRETDYIRMVTRPKFDWTRIHGKHEKTIKFLTLVRQKIDNSEFLMYLARVYIRAQSLGVVFKDLEVIWLHMLTQAFVHVKNIHLIAIYTYISLDTYIHAHMLAYMYLQIPYVSMKHFRRIIKRV